MKLREAFELTLALCRRDAGAPDPALTRPLARAADRGAFHAYAMRQGVLGLVLSAFRARAADAFEPPVAQAILAPLRTLAQQARLWDMERDRVLALLAREGLAPVLLKGAALRLTTYRHAVERPVGDLDLLVPADDMEAVVDRLVGAGYRMPDSQAVIDGFREHHFHLPMHHPNGFEAELHWALTPEVSTHRLDERAFIARAVTVESGGIAARVPCVEHMILHLSSQNTEDHFSKLRRMVDLDRLVAAHAVDWDSVVRDAAHGGLAAPVALSLQLAHHLLGTPLPEDLTQRLGVGRAARVSLALLEPVSGIAHGRGPRRGVGKFLQEVWLATGAARTQHLRRLMAGQEEPLEWLWQGGEAPEGTPRRRTSRTGLALSLALYQCWIAACAPLTLGTAAGRRDLGVWRPPAKARFLLSPQAQP
ncbi:MAG: nucleotidyltransferase family protein [Gemmatimonadota bacterium]